MSRATLLAVLAFAAFVSLGLPDGLIGVAWPSIRREFGLPLDAVGLLLGFTVAGYLVSSFCVGPILRRIPIGSLLALSTLMAAIALLGISLAPSWPALLGFGVLAGLGGGAIDAGLNAYGARHFSGRTLNWLHAFWGLGTTLGPLIVTGVLGSGLVWRWSYAIVGCVQLALAALFLTQRRVWAADAAPGTPAAPQPWLATLRRPVVWAGMATFLLYTGLELSIAVWSYSLLTLGRGMDAAAGGLCVTLYWGSLMTGRILFGLVADRLPPLAVLRGALALAGLGALLLWTGSGPLVWGAGLVVAGGALAPVFASLIRLTPARVGIGHADTAIGCQIAAAGLGGAAVTALIGLLARLFGLGVIGPSLCVAAILLFGFNEALARRRPAL